MEERVDDARADRAPDDAQAAVPMESVVVDPVFVVTQTFPARPSSIPDIRDFGFADFRARDRLIACGREAATRAAPHLSRDLRLGASPRATLQLLRASRAFAAMSGRDYVTPDDVAALGVSVLAHRVLPSTDAQVARRTVTDVIAQAIQSVHIPDRR